MDTLPDYVHEEVILLVEWALTPIGHCSPKEAQANAIASTTLSEVLDRAEQMQRLLILKIMKSSPSGGEGGQRMGQS